MKNQPSQGVGAQIETMHQQSITLFDSPVPAYLAGCIEALIGDRIVNHECWRDRIGPFLCRFALALSVYQRREAAFSIGADQLVDDLDEILNSLSGQMFNLWMSDMGRKEE